MLTSEKGVLHDSVPQKKLLSINIFVFFFLSCCFYLLLLHKVKMESECISLFI